MNGIAIFVLHAQKKLLPLNYGGQVPYIGRVALELKRPVLGILQCWAKTDLQFSDRWEAVVNSLRWVVRVES